MSTEDEVMRLYHQRERPSVGPLASSDEEECFTSRGRVVGVWLTTEPLDGGVVFHGDVDDTVVAPFEVTPDGAEHRVFVVPLAVASALPLRAR